MPLSDCPSQNQLRDLLAGRLPQERHEAIETHVEHCPDCMQRLESLDETEDAFVKLMQGHCTAGWRTADILKMEEAAHNEVLTTKANAAAASELYRIAGEQGRLGDYRLIRQVGSGGMGLVFEAEQISLDRRVALKTLPFVYLLDKKRIKRFLNEARAAASLDHPHIVTVYGVGEERGIHYYAMRFVEGQNLARIVEMLQQKIERGSAEPEIPSWDGLSGSLHRRRVAPTTTAVPESVADSHTDVLKDLVQSSSCGESSLDRDSADLLKDRTIVEQDRTLPEFLASCVPLGDGYVRQIAKLGATAARTLLYAHEQGVVHRDIKPSNLMLDPTGHLWITDFGLARIDSENASTVSGPLQGTIRYMSPEQLVRETEVVDQRCDVYSLGVTLYELLTLTPIFPGLSTRALLSAIPRDEPQLPRRLNRCIPLDLETIILKAMAKDPLDRYQTAGELAQDFTCFLEHKPIAARRPGRGDRTAKWLHRHPAALGTFVTAAIAAVIMAAALGLYSLALQRAIVDREEANQALREANVRAKEATEESKRSESAAHQNVYAQDIEHADRALAMDDTRLADDLLNRHVTAVNGDDLRGFEWHLLSQRCHANGKSLRIADKSVHDVRFSSDGSLFAAGDAEGVLHVWDLARLREIRRIATKHKEINGLAFSPDGKTIATTGDDACIRLWNVANGLEKLRIQRVDLEESHRVLFTPDGKQLISTWISPNIVIWNAETGQPDGELTGHSRTVTDLAVSPDGTQLVSGSSDATLRLWDLKTRSSLRVWEPNEGRVLSVAFSPDGSLVAAGTINATVRIWNVADGSTVLAGRHQDSVHTVAFLPDGARIVGADRAGSVRIWSASERSRKPVDLPYLEAAARPEFPRPLAAWQAHNGRVNRVSVSSRIEQIATVGDDGMLRLIDPDQRTADGRLTVPVTSNNWKFTFGPGDELVFWDLFVDPDGGPGKNAWVHNLQSGTTEHYENRCPWQIVTVAISPNGRDVLFGHRDGKITIRERGKPDTATVWDLNITNAIAELHFAHQGKALIVQVDGSDDAIRIFDYPSHRRLENFPRSNGSCIEISHDERFLAFRHERFSHVWDLGATMLRPRKFEHRDDVVRIAISPDGRLIAEASENRNIAVRDVDSGQVLYELVGHQSIVKDVVFLADGRTLVSGSQMGVVKLWHLATGRFLLELARFDRPISEIQLSPSGRYLAYATDRGKITVHDLEALHATR